MRHSLKRWTALLPAMVMAASLLPAVSLPALFRELPPATVNLTLYGAGEEAYRGLAVSFQLIPQARRSAGRRLPGRGRAEADRAEARTALIVQRSAAQKMRGKR